MQQNDAPPRQWLGWERDCETRNSARSRRCEKSLRRRCADDAFTPVHLLMRTHCCWKPDTAGTAVIAAQRSDTSTKKQTWAEAGQPGAFLAWCWRAVALDWTIMGPASECAPRRSPPKSWGAPSDGGNDAGTAAAQPAAAAVDVPAAASSTKSRAGGSSATNSARRSVRADGAKFCART